MINKDSENEKISIKKSLGVNWREHFIQESVIDEIIDKVGLKANYDYVRIHSKLFIDDDRVAVRIVLKNKTTGIVEKAIIDVISAFPTMEQLIDVNFSIGSDCSHRIIVFDMYPDRDDSEKYELCGPVLMSSIMKKRPVSVPVYFLNTVNSITDVISSMSFDIYETIEPDNEYPASQPDYENIYFVLSLWEAYRSCILGFQIDYWNPPLRGCDEHSIPFVEYASYWNKGIVHTEISLDAEEFEWLRRRKENELNDMLDSYGPAEVNDNKNMITVVKKIPLSNFVYSPDERESFKSDAHNGIGLSYSISDFMEENY